MRQTNFNTGLRGGLFDAKHYAQMGPAIWLYGWLVLRQTQQRDGVGLVLGGHAVSYREIESETGFCRKTLERWMKTLRRAGYIETIAAPAGVVVRITKAKKFFKAASRRDFHSPVENYPRQSSNLRRGRRNFDPDAPQIWGCPPQNRGDGEIQRVEIPADSRGICSGEVAEKTKRISNTDSHFHSSPRDTNQKQNLPAENIVASEGFDRVASGVTIDALKAKMQQREWRFRREQREEALRRELRVGAGPQVDG